MLVISLLQYSRFPSTSWLRQAQPPQGWLRSTVHIHIISSARPNPVFRHAPRAMRQVPRALLSASRAMRPAPCAMLSSTSSRFPMLNSSFANS
jgi:hypothetical protein